MLSSWHLTPEYINEHWTEEMLCALLKARVERRTPINTTTQAGSAIEVGGKKYMPEHNLPVDGLVGKMAQFGSRAMKITTR